MNAIVKRPKAGTAAGELRPGRDSTGGREAGDERLLRAAEADFRARKERQKLFGLDLVGDPAWDIMLYLFIATFRERPVTITEACCAAAVPATTGQRCINRLAARKMVLKVPNPADRRGGLVFLTEDWKARLALHIDRYPDPDGANDL